MVGGQGRITFVDGFIVEEGRASSAETGRAAAKRYT